MALPGFSTTISDGGLRIRQTLGGERVLILGATDNTVLELNEPAVVQDVVLAMQAARNTTGTETDLSLALADALRGGAQFVEICKVSTQSGSADYYATGYTPSDRYTALSGAYSALAGHDTTIVIPAGAYAEEVPGDTLYALGETHLTGVFYTGGTHAAANFALQLAQYAYDQTTDFRSTVGVISVKPPMLAPIVGGATGAATGTAGATFGTPSRTAVANWVSYLTAGTGLPVSTPWLNYMSGSTAAYATTYFPTWQANATKGVPGSGSSTDDLSNPVDLGAYITVFAAPVRTSGANTVKMATEFGASTSSLNFNTDGAASYAGQISSLSPHSATTNKIVPGLVASRALTNTQAETLRDKRLVGMLQKSKGFVVVEDVTGAYYVDKFTKSDFHRLSTVRITHNAVNGIRDAGEQFIGEGVNAALLNALHQSVEGVLRAMQLAGALRRFSFQIVATPDQQSLGEATILLELIPAFELTNVTVGVRLAKE